MLSTLSPTLVCCLWGAQHPKIHNSQNTGPSLTLLCTLSPTLVCCLWGAQHFKIHNSRNTGPSPTLLCTLSPTLVCTTPTLVAPSCRRHPHTGCALPLALREIWFAVSGERKPIAKKNNPIGRKTKERSKRKMKETKNRTTRDVQLQTTVDHVVLSHESASTLKF